MPRRLLGMTHDDGAPDAGTPQAPSGSGAKTALVVVGILAVVVCGAGALVGITLGRRVNAAEQRAHVLQTQAQLQNLEFAITAYGLQHKALPATLDLLVGPDGPLAGDSVPADAWGRPFEYVPGDDGKSYTLRSLGADGAPGGADEAADITRDGLQGESGR